jgi:hypothetical protein
MRYLAYAMLISGFIWICFDQFALGPIQRAVMMASYDKIPKQQSYTHEDIQKAVSDTVHLFARLYPSFYIGGLLMLGGGVVLDFARRRK